MRLGDFVHAHPDWIITKEYVDIASATDLGHRQAWKALQDDALKHRFEAVLVFKLDRAFRSVKHLHDMLSVWDKIPIGFLSAQEGFDTTTATGRLLMNILGSLAEFELEMIRERVVAGMDRAQREGKAIGRPRIADDPKRARQLARAVEAVRSGTLSYRKAAHHYGFAVSSIQQAMKEG